MNQDIKNIKIRLESIEKKIDKILESILKMDNHVDFVEDVYDTIRHPISFICNKITPLNLFILLIYKS